MNEYEKYGLNTDVGVSQTNSNPHQTPEDHRSTPDIRNPQQLREYVKNLKRPDMPEKKPKAPKYHARRIDWNAVSDALVEGAKPAEAMKVGGSSAKHPSNLLHQKLRKDKDYASSLSNKLQRKINLAVNAITKEKLEDEPAFRNAHTLDVLIKNKRLIENESTSNVSIRGRIDVGNMSKEEVVRAYRDYIHG